MKNLILLAVILLAACGLSSERIKSPEPQETSSKVQVSRLLNLAERLVQHQRKAQPNSWDVSFEESMKKENPLSAPVVVLNSGVPPNLVDGRPPMDVGLWNCRTLKVGSSFCQDGLWEHMIAINFKKGKSSKVTGLVAVYGTADHSLVASCTESGAVEIEISTQYYDSRYQGKELEFEFGFDNEPFVRYEINRFNGIVMDTRLLFAKLMDDFTSVKIKAPPTDSESTTSMQFVVKNFPKAWTVACGWHVGYDAITGIK